MATVLLALSVGAIVFSITAMVAIVHRRPRYKRGRPHSTHAVK